jgi:chromosome segregation ATPase
MSLDESRLRLAVAFAFPLSRDKSAPRPPPMSRSHLVAMMDGLAERHKVEAMVQLMNDYGSVLRPLVASKPLWRAQACIRSGHSSLRGGGEDDVVQFAGFDDPWGDSDLRDPVMSSWLSDLPVQVPLMDELMPERRREADAEEVRRQVEELEMQLSILQNGASQSQDKTADRVAALEAQLSAAIAAKEFCERLATENGGRRGDDARLNALLATKTAEVDTLRSELDGIRSASSQQQQEIASKEEELGRLRGQLDEKDQLVAESARLRQEAEARAKAVEDLSTEAKQQDAAARIQRAQTKRAATRQMEELQRQLEALNKRVQDSEAGREAAEAKAARLGDQVSVVEESANRLSQEVSHAQKTAVQAAEAAAAQIQRAEEKAAAQVQRAEAADRMKAEADARAEAAEQNMETAQRRVTEIETQLREAQERVAAIEQQLAEASNQQTSLTDNQSRLERDLEQVTAAKDACVASQGSVGADLESVRQQLDANRQRQTVLEQQLATANQSVAKTQDLQISLAALEDERTAFARRIETLESQNQTLTESVQEYTRQQQPLIEALKQAKDRLIASTRDSEALQGQLRRAQESLETVQTQKTDLERSANAAILEATTERDQCKTDMKARDDQDATQQEMREEIARGHAETKQRYDALVVEHNKTLDELVRVRAELREAQDRAVACTQLTEADSSLAEIQERVLAKEQQKRELEGQILILETQITALETQQRELRNRKAEYDELERQLQGVTSEQLERRRSDLQLKERVVQSRQERDRLNAENKRLDIEIAKATDDRQAKQDTHDRYQETARTAKGEMETAKRDLVAAVAARDAMRQRLREFTNSPERATLQDMQRRMTDLEQRARVTLEASEQEQGQAQAKNAAFASHVQRLRELTAQRSATA